MLLERIDGDRDDGDTDRPVLFVHDDEARLRLEILAGFIAFRPIDEDLAGAVGEGSEIFLLVALPIVGGDGALPDIQSVRIRDEKFENRALRGVLFSLR